ncbi:MAG: hypothetical protein EAZ85_00505 [Bacteroidetes bacterium]|nr:MAG: hypothetical protein EAZ85_00505 [Bacteroidota bacterium]TAG89347.1 MAG: hypothetical protein EAZ20_06645 [Bacteroidota bacterium]
MKNLTWLSLLMMITLFSACGNAKSGKTKSGIEYQIHSTKKGKKIKAGDFVTFHFMTKGVINGKDSVMGSTFKEKNPLKDFQVPDKINGDYMLEGLLMFAEGDSATFKIPNDSMFARQKAQIQKQITMIKQQEKSLDTIKSLNDESRKQMRDNIKQQLESANKALTTRPTELPEKKYIAVTVKILKVLNAKEREADAKKEAEKAQKDAEALKIKEAKTIEEYAKKNDLKVEKTASGLYYVITKEGTGNKPKAGDEVKVSYTGMFLDGNIFDTSIEEDSKKAGLDEKQKGRKYGPIDFPLGMSRVIPGWDEGLALLPKGSKAVFLVPSGLAYGKQGRGQIPPDAILRFNVELVDFTPAKAPETTKPNPVVK